MVDDNDGRCEATTRGIAFATRAWGVEGVLRAASSRDVPVSAGAVWLCWEQNRPWWDNEKAKGEKKSQERMFLSVLPRSMGSVMNQTRGENIIHTLVRLKAFPQVNPFVSVIPHVAKSEANPKTRIGRKGSDALG